MFLVLKSSFTAHVREVMQAQFLTGIFLYW